MEELENVLNKEVNKQWKSRWEGIAKYDFDYDGDFLTKIVCNALKLRMIYYQDLMEDVSKKEAKMIAKILKQLSECYDLGHKILTFNYGKLADASHTLEDYTEMTQLACKDRIADQEQFYKMIGKYINGWSI